MIIPHPPKISHQFCANPMTHPRSNRGGGSTPCGHANATKNQVILYDASVKFVCAAAVYVIIKELASNENLRTLILSGWRADFGGCFSL